jgi:membrane protein DedA with SNARE-associated domain
VTEKVLENDILAMMVAVLAPPPLPTKIFMLVAGGIGMPVPRFVAAVFAGRMIRFGGEAYLAVRLGDQALGTLRQYYPFIGAVLALAVVVYLVVKWLQKRRTL